MASSHWNHQCQTCHKGFTKEFALAQHVQDAHGLKYQPYCPLCDKYFVDGSALSQHKRDSPKHASHNQSHKKKTRNKRQNRLHQMIKLVKNLIITAKNIALNVMNMVIQPHWNV